MSRVATATLSFNAETNAFFAALDEAKERATGLGDQFKAVGKDLQKFGDSTTGFGKSVSTNVSLPVTAGLAAMVAFAVGTASVADAVAKNAREAGLSAESYQELTFALGQVAQITDEELNGAFARMSQTIGDATAGTSTAVTAMRQLGFTQAEIAAGTITSEQAFNAFNTAMQNSESAATATALATDLVGRSAGAALAGALRTGGDQVDVLRGQARDLGLVMSGETLDAAEVFNDSLDVLTKQFGMLGVEIGKQVMPIIQRDLIPFIQDTAIPAIRSIVEVVASLISWFGELPGPVKAAAAVIAGIAVAAGPVIVVVGSIISGFGSIMSVVGAVIPIITSLGTGLLALAAVPGAPLILVGAAVAAVIAGVVYFREEIMQMVRIIGSTVLAGFSRLTGAASKIAAAFGVKGLSKSLSDLSDWLGETSEAVTAQTKEIAKETEAVKEADEAVEAHTPTLRAFTTQTKEAEEAQKKFRESVDQLKQSVTVNRSEVSALNQALLELHRAGVPSEAIVKKLGGTAVETAQALTLMGETVPKAISEIAFSSFYAAVVEKNKETLLKVEEEAKESWTDTLEYKTEQWEKGLAGEVEGYGKHLDHLKTLDEEATAEGIAIRDHMIGVVEGLQKDSVERQSEAMKNAVDDVKSAAGAIFDAMFLKGENVFSSLGNMLKGGALSLGRSIFEDITGELLGPIKKAFDDFFTGLLEGTGIKSFISGLGSKLGGLLGGIFDGGGGVADVAGGAASAAGGVASSAGGVASSAGGMMTGLVGGIAGGVISGLGSFLGSMRLEGTMNAVEYNTRASELHLRHMIDQILWPIHDHVLWAVNEQLPWLAFIDDKLRQTFDHLKEVSAASASTINEIRDLLRQGHEVVINMDGKEVARLQAPHLYDLTRNEGVVLVGTR